MKETWVPMVVSNHGDRKSPIPVFFFRFQMADIYGL